MKLIALLVVSSILACNACHPLEAVADKVPLQLVCPDSDGAAAKQAVAEVVAAPKATWDKYVEIAKHDPAGVACLTLDARQAAQDTLAELRAKGEQASEAYRQTEEALALINDGLEALNLK